MHSVYFTLAEPSAERIDGLLAACRKYLTVQPGIRTFACGPVAALERDVNVKDWHVALHILFDDVAAHDAYQVDPTHEKFVAEQKSYWSQVRVFDADVG